MFTYLLSDTRYEGPENRDDRRDDETLERSKKEDFSPDRMHHDATRGAAAPSHGRTPKDSADERDSAPKSPPPVQKDPFEDGGSDVATARNASRGSDSSKR